MPTKDKARNLAGEIKRVPIINIHVITDDEWNRIAHRYWIERRCHA